MSLSAKTRGNMVIELKRDQTKSQMSSFGPRIMWEWENDRKGPKGHLIKDQGHKSPLGMKVRAKWSFCKKYIK